jgi:hypothetical protein
MSDKVTSAQAVAKLISGKKTKTAGILGKGFIENDTFVSFEPAGRQRLDHYGNDGDGWDEDAWFEDYAAPLTKEISAVLQHAGISGWYVEVGDKGFVEVFCND